MPLRVDVAPALLAWAQQRSGLDPEALARKFPKLSAWESGAASPTLKQLESFAQTTHTPIGLLFLREPPEDRLPVPDFRTIADRGVRVPSPDLLDTVHACELRQDWYRDHVIAEGQPALAFVGSLRTSTPIKDAAAEMRDLLRFDLETRRAFSTWTDAFRGLSERAEYIGVLVMVNGVVGSNPHRPLDPDEFRGFALVDNYAPIVFVNGADSKAAQIFTLAHELAHVWLGESGVSDAGARDEPLGGIEQWCNQVAAEFLVPAGAIADTLSPDEPLADALQRLARTYRVSTLVALRRLHDTGQITRNAYHDAYETELASIAERDRDRPGGGSFYNTQPVRVSKTFARAVINSTLEGRTLQRDAYRLLGLKKHATFQQMGNHLGVT